MELHGGFVLPNRLVETDCQGHLVWTCHLFNVPVVDVVADNTRHNSNNKRYENHRHRYHLLPCWINATTVRGGIGSIVSEKF